VTRGQWLLTGSTFVILAVLASAAALVWHPALPAMPPPAPATFDAAVVKRGESLSHVANCTGCHTARGGKPLTGGRPLETPFGTIFATNITPDPATGIGGWSREAFVRAMREGVARNGDLLYPAFPYDHFTRANDADLGALYAFLMTREPVVAPARPNRLEWPLDFRPLLAGWNLLYLHKGSTDTQDRGRDRGEYLAEGLAHCGGCHTPRNRLGAEKRDHDYDGAWTEGWYAPALNASSPAVQPWTADELFAYLRTGLSLTHAAAAGPMGDVTRELALADEGDVRAIAGHFARLMAKAPAARSPAPTTDKQSAADQAHPEGAAMFAGACAACHEAGAPMMQQGRPTLAWGTPLHLATPNDALHVIVHGLTPPAGRAGPTMPAFGDDFTARQLAEIAAYLRARYTDKPAWQEVERAVGDVRTRGAP
jgi:mono/diheme cytochrome c family protein